MFIIYYEFFSCKFPFNSEIKSTAYHGINGDEVFE